jgi:acyl-CoA synthetase (AMP-forming)/AMP-acid ligase II/ferredoxin
VSSLEELSTRALARDASQPSIEFQDRWISWGEMRHVAERIGSLIDSSGIPAHAPIALVARNRPSAVAALLGLISRSHTVRMVYPFQSAAAMAGSVERLKPAAVLGAPEDFTPELREMLRKRAMAALALTEMDATSVPGFERCDCSDIQVPEQPRIEILTSGTTGPPKQFAISFELIARHHVGVQMLTPDPASDPLQMPPMPLFFPLGNISGIYSTLPTLLRGRRAQLWDRFSVAAWRDYVLRYRPELTGLPPAGVQMVLDANIPVEDLASIRLLSTGAAALDPTVQRAFEERYGIPILLSYGATEFAGPVAAMTAELQAEWGKRKFGSVGRALPGAQLRVVDPDTGAVLPPGQEGILEVISPRIGPDWIRTSDIALLDADGFLFHRGRADGAIMRGGFKILPETIERALVSHPAVSAAAVVGIPDNRLGQVPAAAIQLKPGFQTPTVDDLEAHLRTQVLATHVPVTWCLVRQLPRNASMKTDAVAVARLFVIPDEVVVRLQGKTHRLKYQRGETLLETMRRSGLVTPFLCEQGVCGTCMARRIRGEVELRENHVLSERDLADGYILACQSLPSSEVCEIEIDV